MKKLLLLVILGLLISCNREVERKPLTEEEKLQQLKTKNDSIMLVYDSLMTIKIDLPQVVDYNVIDSVSNQQFKELATSTGGNLQIILSAKFVTEEIVKIIEAHSENNADVLFLIDKTSSMDDDIDNVKQGVKDIVRSLKKFENNRLGIALYGDKNSDGADWFQFRNFETDYEGASSFINRVVLTPGDDYPESIFDGFFEMMSKDFWKSGNKRIIILVGDAPSLLPPLSQYTLDDVIKKAHEYKINMNFYPILISPYPPEQVGVEPRMQEMKLMDNLFPNPSAGVVNISFPAKKEYAVELYSQDGKLISSENVIEDTYRKELYDQPNGVYIFRIIDKNKNYENRKFILQK